MPTVTDIAVGNIIEHIAGGTIRGRRTQLATKWFVRTVTGVQPYPAGILAIQNALMLAINTLYRDCCSPDWTLNVHFTQRIAATETLYPPVRSKGVYQGGGGVGTFTGVSDFGEIAGAIVRFSYLSGKTEQGELRVGPLPNAAVTAGDLTGAAVTRLGALATRLTSNVTAAAGAIVLEPVAWRTGTKAVPHQPFASQYFGAIIGPHHTTMNRRRDKPLEI